MTSAPPASTLVLTTASPGLAWSCIHAAGVDPYEAAVITSPGAAVGSLDGDVGRQLAILVGLSAVTQITVVGHRDDPIYGALLPPEPGRPPGTGGLAGLGEGAAQTVRATVERLADSWQVPKGTVVSGIVVEGDGTADNVAIEIARGGRRPTRDDGVKIRVQGADVGWDDLGVDLDRALATDNLPSLDVALMESLPVATATAPSTSEILAGAENTDGPLGQGGEVFLGPTGLGGKLTSGPSSIGDAEGPLQSSGPIGSGHSADACGPHSLDQEIDGPLSRREENHIQRSTGAAHLGAGAILAAPEPPAKPFQGHGEPDLLEAWFQRDTRRRGPGQTPKPATLQHRLEGAAGILGRFVDHSCEGHDLFKQTLRLHQAGASPDAVMRGLKGMIRDLGRGQPDVEAALSTLEMAQALLSKDEMRLVLRKILV